MVETKKEYKESIKKGDDLFLGGRMPTINVNAIEDKAAFVNGRSARTKDGTLSSGTGSS